jgi:hypothetical protein
MTGLAAHQFRVSLALRLLQITALPLAPISFLLDSFVVLVRFRCHLIDSPARVRRTAHEILFLLVLHGEVFLLGPELPLSTCLVEDCRSKTNNLFKCAVIDPA